MSTVRLRFKKGDVLTDATGVVLSDVTATFGVKRDDTDAVVVAAGTAMTRMSTGVYEHTFDDPAGFLDSTYTFVPEVTYGGEIYRFPDTQAGPTSDAGRLIGVTDAKTYLDVTGTDDDTVIGNMLDAATVALEKAAGRHLVSTAVTEYLDGQAERRVWLQEPAESITSVHVDSDQGWDATSLISADDYAVEGCTLDYISRVWTRGRRNMRVIYQAGFATVPEDLQHAARVQVAKLYSEWQVAKKGLNVLKSHSVQGWSQTFLEQKGLAPEAAAIVERYRPERL